MTKEQYEAIIATLDEWIPIEKAEGIKPRLAEFKGDLQAIQVHGNRVSIEEMDWETVDGLLTEKYNAFLKDYTVAQIRKRDL